MKPSAIRGVILPIAAVIGMAIPSSTGQYSFSLSMVALVFALSFLVTLGACEAEKLSLCLGRWLAEKLGQKPHPIKQGFVFSNLGRAQLVGYSFIGLGAGAIIRAFVWKDETTLVGGACFAFATGLLSGVRVIKRSEGNELRRGL